MIIQLNPPMPLFTPKGNALAYYLIDDGIEFNLQWVCFLNQNGECWTFRNPDIRAQINITQGRDYISPFYDPKDVEFRREEIEAEKDDLWYKVEESLPYTHTSCLVTDCADIYLAYIGINGEWYEDTKFKPHLPDITHWKELPSMPSQSERGAKHD